MAKCQFAICCGTEVFEIFDTTCQLNKRVVRDIPLDICVPDICTVFAEPAAEQLSIEGGRVRALISEPVSKE